MWMADQLPYPPAIAQITLCSVKLCSEMSSIAFVICIMKLSFTHLMY